MADSPITYTISEVKGDKTYYTYDETVQTINVTLVDNGDGTITATPDKTGAQVTFTNEYEATGSLDFDGLKTLKLGDLADKEFKFELVRVDKKIIGEEEVQIETVAVGGKDSDSEAPSTDDETAADEGDDTSATESEDTSAEFNFETIKFTKNKDIDECGEYVYRIREVVPANAVAQFTDEDGNVTAVKYSDATDEQKANGKFILGNYQYDTTEYEIKVTVTDNGDGTLNVAKDPEKTGDYDVEFTNVKAFTDLVITKKLNAFVEGNAKEVTLAFEISGKTADNKDYKAAAGLTFTETEVLNGAKKTVTVEKVPTGTTISVKEVYASNFKPEGDNPKKATLDENGIYTVEFINNYDNVIYNTGAINKYKKNENGGYDPPDTSQATTKKVSPGDQKQE